MQRREFIGILGAAAAWPLAARGQTKRVRRVGVLMGSSESDSRGYVDAFVEELMRLNTTKTAASSARLISVLTPLSVTRSPRMVALVR
jgi:hypothetical protein